MRYLAQGIEYSLVFEPEYIQDIACRDEKDKEILNELRGAGEYGMLCVVWLLDWAINGSHAST